MLWVFLARCRNRSAKMPLFLLCAHSLPLSRISLKDVGRHLEEDICKLRAQRSQLKSFEGAQKTIGKLKANILNLNQETGVLKIAAEVVRADPQRSILVDAHRSAASAMIQRAKAFEEQFHNLNAGNQSLN